MGYERKRGKLADLNAFLRGDAADAFSLIVGNTDGLTNVRYVITLDTDTELPRDSARKFVATMAHPLNRPQYDEKNASGSVKVTASCNRAWQSACQAPTHRVMNCFAVAKLVSIRTPAPRPMSIRMYSAKDRSSARASTMSTPSNMRCTTACLKNRILSHDLLEGCYARSGLLSDVQLYEAYPSCYSADVSRRHRWIRGDWQIASWLLPRVPGARDASTGKLRRHRNPLSALSRWKLFDNLRRSVVPFALTALLLIGWSTLPSAWFWTCAVLGILLIPSVCTFIFNLARLPEDVLFRQHFSALLRSTTQYFTHAALTLIFLPYEAWFNLDAILRTLWRILCSHRGLLEWNPSSEANRQSGNGLYSYYRAMWIAPVLAVATTAYLIADNQNALQAATPILLLWCLSPAIACWISRPIGRRAAHLSNEQTRFLKSLSRKMWLFF
ncbi:hypothetical protein ACFS07_08230 [Undibacterium arcticum]